MRLSDRIASAFVIFLFSLVLCIRTDGYFPFNSGTNPALLYGSSLIVVVLAFVLVYFLATGRAIFKFKFTEKSLRKILTGVIISFYLVHFVLTLRSYNNFLGESDLNIPILVGVSIISVTALVLAFLYSHSVRTILVTTGAAFLAISVIQIVYFPLISYQSDLMPIVIEQGRALLRGENIYQFYLLDNGVLTQAVRQPGNIVAYLPAVALGIDPRYLSIIYTILTAGVLLRITYPKLNKLKVDTKFLLVSLLISLFLFFPYRLVRSELYEPPFWFLFSLGILFIKERRFYLSSIIWGIGIFTQVWFWLFTPFYFLYLLKNSTWKSTFKSVAITLIIAAITMLPFILGSPGDYYHHVFGYYQGVVKDGIVYWNNYYLTPIFHALNLRSALSLVQFGAVAVVGLLAIKYMKTLRQFVMFMSIAFLVFIQFNSLSWNYFYINLVFFLIIYQLLNRDTSEKTE